MSDAVVQRPKRKYTRRQQPAPKAATKPGTVGELLEASAPAGFPGRGDAAIDRAAVIGRPPLREPVRDEDPRTAAMRRAQEWFQHIDSLPEGNDKFYIDPARIPDGWTYEWKRWTTINKEDPQYQVSLQQTAWTPVPASRHPEMMPTGFKGDSIDIDGMRLMERPEMITAWQRDRDRIAAEAPIKGIRNKLAAAPQGTFERANPGGANPVAIKTEFAPPPAIPRE